MDLSINYEETRNVGNQLVSKADELATALKNINNANAGISESWVGTDAARYVAAVNEQAQYIDLLALTIGDIGRYLIRVSNAYEEAGQSNSSAINL